MVKTNLDVAEGHCSKKTGVHSLPRLVVPIQLLDSTIERNPQIHGIVNKMDFKFQSSLRRASKKMGNSMTPPMATRSRNSSVSSFDEAYFSKTYVPLSNLPTPPLSSHSNDSTQVQPAEELFSPEEYLDPQLIGILCSLISP